MKQELDEKLVKAFPNLYRDRNASMMATCMCWGFECGDGWFQIIWDLSEKLEPIIAAMPEDRRAMYRASQVKEKFGTLRFYMNGETKEMSELIRVAEGLSEKTCEDCGSDQGSETNLGWIRTLCSPCTDKRREGKLRG